MIRNMARQFIEVTVKNHLISHGYDNNNREIIEEVQSENWSKKAIRADRIQSIGEKYILTTYAHNRWIYWEYQESYQDIVQQLNE